MLPVDATLTHACPATSGSCKFEAFIAVQAAYVKLFALLPGVCTCLRQLHMRGVQRQQSACRAACMLPADPAVFVHAAT